MATIDLGKIKQVWRGTYSSSNTYTADDLVEYTDNQITSTYIAVATSSFSNQAPSTSGTINSSYWAFVAKGVANPIPAQSSSTNGKALISDGTNASWGEGGAWTKIASGVGPSTAATSISINNIFSDTYKFYKVLISWTQDDWLKMRFIKSSDNSTQSGSYYIWSFFAHYENNDGSERNGRTNENYALATWWNGTDNGYSMIEMSFCEPYASGKSTGYASFSGYNTNGQVFGSNQSGFYNITESHKGLTFFGNAGDGFTDANFRYLILGANIG